MRKLSLICYSVIVLLSFMFTGASVMADTWLSGYIPSKTYPDSADNPVEGTITATNRSGAVVSVKCWDADDNKTIDWTSLATGTSESVTCEGTRHLRLDYQCIGCRSSIRTYANACESGSAYIKSFWNYC